MVDELEGVNNHDVKCIGARAESGQKKIPEHKLLH